VGRGVDDARGFVQAGAREPRAGAFGRV